MDLLQRFALGEIDAFETLVRQFQGEIYAWTMRIVRDPGTAEDLTVETLWRIYCARQQFRPDSNFGAWARRIATNLALDHLRRARPEQVLEAEPAGALQPDRLVEREMREKMQRVRPQTIGQASRIPGVTPAAVSLINVYIEIQGRKQRATT